MFHRLQFAATHSGLHKEGAGLLQGLQGLEGLLQPDLAEEHGAAIGLGAGLAGQGADLGVEFEGGLVGAAGLSEVALVEMGHPDIGQGIGPAQWVIEVLAELQHCPVQAGGLLPLPAAGVDAAQDQQGVGLSPAVLEAGEQDQGLLGVLPARLELALMQAEDAQVGAKGGLVVAPFLAVGLLQSPL